MYFYQIPVLKVTGLSPVGVTEGIATKSPIYKGFFLLM